MKNLRKSCYLYTLVEKRKSKNEFTSTLANRVIGHGPWTLSIGPFIGVIGCAITGVLACYR